MKGMRLSTGRLVLFALLGAILVGLQVAMAALPNVEALIFCVFEVIGIHFLRCTFAKQLNPKKNSRKITYPYKITLENATFGCYNYKCIYI